MPTKVLGVKPRNVECQRNPYVTVNISVRYVQCGLDVEIGNVWSSLENGNLQAETCNRGVCRLSQII